MEQTPFFSISTFSILLVAIFVILYLQGTWDFKKGMITVVLCTLFALSHGKKQVIGTPYIKYGVSMIMVVLAIGGLAQSIRKSNKMKKIQWDCMAKDVGVWLAILFFCFLPILFMGMKSFVFLGKGFLSALLSFGGGDAYLTVADSLFVGEGYLSEKQFYSQIVSVVNLLPGSILCKTLSGVGYCLGFDWYGTFVAGILFAVCGFATSIAVSCGFFTCIYYVYESMTDLPVFRLISQWIRPMIAGLLLTIVLSLLNQSIRAVANIGIQNSNRIGILFPLGLWGLLLFLSKKTKLSNVILLVIAIVTPFIFLHS